MDKIPNFMPIGRLDDLKGREDVELIAYALQGEFGFTAKLRKFNSRKALEAFCKDGSRMHALVKTPVQKNYLTNHNTQRIAQ